MSFDIKQLIAEGYTVICDTNVFLNIYRYSPEFSDFALRCMQAVFSSIMLPSTVKYEFLKHYKACYDAMKKRVRKVSNDANSTIKDAARKVLRICDNLRVLKYANYSELKNDLSEKFDELIDISEKFFEDRHILDLIANPWNGKNLVYELVEHTIACGQVMSPVTQEEIYQICEEGEKRYKADPPIPPGFKDAKDKDGVKKYSDLIIWKEIIKYAKTASTNVIFVTDDVKSDWWTNINNQIDFHPQLIKEFESETGKKILPFTSTSFLDDVSRSYHIPQTDAVEIALRITDTDYFERVCDTVFESVADSLIFSGEKYIDPSAHIGSYGLDELEITESTFVSAEQITRLQDTIIYLFVFRITAEATSSDYWCRDDETKEILLAPTGSHTFEGEITVQVIREADMYLDFEADNDFESAMIVSGNLIETSFEPLYEEDEHGEDIYNVCPDCGREMNIENDGGNGFCTECAPNH